MRRSVLILTAALLIWALRGATPAAAHTPYDGEIAAACAVYGCSPGYLESVMLCESGGDPNAVGPHGELGIFQVDPRYWGYMSSSQQIWFAAEHLTRGDIYWACA